MDVTWTAPHEIHFHIYSFSPPLYSNAALTMSEQGRKRSDLYQLVSQSTFLIPRGIANTCILFRVCVCVLVERMLQPRMVKSAHPGEWLTCFEETVSGMRQPSCLQKRWSHVVVVVPLTAHITPVRPRGLTLRTNGNDEWFGHCRLLRPP